MGLGSGGGDSTSVTKSEPWGEQQLFLKGGFQSAFQNANGYENNGYWIPFQNGNYGVYAPEYYSGNTVAGMSPETQQALQLQSARGLNGSDLTRAAQQQATDTLNGKYLDLNSNPYLQGAIQLAQNQTLANSNAAFAKSGRYGSSNNQAANLSAAGNIATTMANEAYNTERNRMQVAGQMANDLANQDYRDYAALSEAGGLREEYDQSKINEAIDRYNYNSTRPLTAIQNYMNLIQGNYGGTTTGTSQQNDNRSGLGKFIGGAASGAAMGSAAGPWGALAGAGVSGLLSFL